MTISSTQVLAAAGLTNGIGLSVSSEMLSQFSAFDAKPIVAIINNMYSGAANTVSNVTGLYTSLASLPRWTTGRDGNVQISSNASSRANLIIPNAPSGIKTFSTFLNIGSAFSVIATDWNAAVNKFQDKKFSDLGLQNKNYNELASAGISGYFSALDTIPGGRRAGLQLLSKWVREYGYAARYSTGLNQAFGPKALVLQIRNYNLGDVGGLNSILAAAGIVSNDDLQSATDDIIIAALQQVTSSSDIKRIRTQLFVEVNILDQKSLADLITAKKALPKELQGLAPGGYVTDLNQNLGRLNGNFPTPDQLSEFLARIEIPEYQALNSLDKPVPPEAVALLSPSIGRGLLPTVDGVTENLGTGPVGNPTTVDMFGSAAGARYTEAFRVINNAHDYAGTIAEGVTLTNALQALYNADKTSSPTAGLKTALDTAITNYNRRVVNESPCQLAQSSMARAILQNVREVTLHTLADINLSSPPASLGTIGPLILAQSLANNGDLLYGMANVTTSYGEAIRAAIQESRNQSQKDLADIPDNITSNTQDEIRNVTQNQIGQLTEKQKQNIIDDARATGSDPNVALSNAEKYGYDREYYAQKGYPEA